MTEKSINIAADGTIQFVWDDELAPLIHVGHAKIRRASDVEPVSVFGFIQSRWCADMSRSDGPLLGPFPLRGQAIDAEHEWLQKNVLNGGPAK